MQVLCLDFLVRNDFCTVEHPELWNVEQYLRSIVLLILDRVVAEVKLGKERKKLNVL